MGLLFAISFISIIQTKITMHDKKHLSLKLLCQNDVTLIWYDTSETGCRSLSINYWCYKLILRSVWLSCKSFA